MDSRGDIFFYNNEIAVLHKNIILLRDTLLIKCLHAYKPFGFQDFETLNILNILLNYTNYNLRLHCNRYL